MNFTFYNQLATQPDLQDAVEYLTQPLHLLDSLQKRLKELPINELKSASFAEVDSKVERLINKHFPNLVNDYCSLSLEYRNTRVIKKEKSQESTLEYTAKEVLLKNFGKLIEEIHVLEHEFNDNYTHKLLVQSRIVNELGIQKKLIETEDETNNIESVNLKNNFDYKNFSKTQKVQVIVPKVEEKEIQEEVIENITGTEDSLGWSISLVELTMIMMTFAMIVTMCIVFYNQTNNATRGNDLLTDISDLQRALSTMHMENNEGTYKNLSINSLAEKGYINQKNIKDGKYENPFKGEYNIKNEGDNGYAISMTKIPQQVCQKMLADITMLPVQSASINDIVVMKNHKVDFMSGAIACEKDENTIKLIDKLID